MLLDAEVGGSVIGELIESELGVRDLAFDREGRFLAVARELPDPPYFGRVDIHRLDLAELAELARRTAGRRLRYRELPPPLRRDLAEEDLAALDLADPSRRGPKGYDKMSRGSARSRSAQRFDPGENS